jgi:hypothetical protein
MRETNTILLARHFFSRFFENDVVQAGGDLVTTVVRALAVVAAPGLMFAFWLQNQYVRRAPWGRIEDEYFFVMFSFVTMAGVAIFEWEMLFPDRLDFLVLSPLSLRGWEMPAAKAAALAVFLGLFLAAANVFGIFMLPAVTGGHLWRQMAAQAAAVLLAGIFGALVVMLAGGVLLCALPARLFRTVSLLFRMLSVTALGLVIVHYARFGDALEPLLANGGHKIEWLPTFWFLGLYQRAQHGGAAPQFAFWMARRAEIATAIVVLGVACIYPVAWIRMRRMAMEEQMGNARHAGRWLRALVDAMIRTPEERAVFHFIGQTVARNSRYQVYMAIYIGTGLALAVSCATRVQRTHGAVSAGLSRFGLHAVMPLLVFWTIAGLKIAFAFPLQLQARWIFRTTGAALERCVGAVKTWAFGCGTCVVVAITAALAGMGWSGRELLVQVVCGLCLCAVLVDAFFFAQATVPFSQPQRAGRSSLPLILTLYLGVLAPFVFAMIVIEQRMEKDLLLVVWPIALVPVVQSVLRSLRKRAVLIEEEREGADGEFQLLGLSGDLSA